MAGHRAVVTVGPGTVGRLCCGAAASADAAAALEWIDDPVALVDGQPVAVPELLRTALAGLACPVPAESVLVIHPTWWSAARVDLLRTAARVLTGTSGNVVTRPRSPVLARAGPGGRAGVVIEIAATLVAVTAAETVAEPRLGTPDQVAAAVARAVAAMARGAASVVIDSPDAVGGATTLAGIIADRLRSGSAGADVTVVDDAHFARLIAPAPPAGPASRPAPEPRRDRAARNRRPLLTGLAGAAGVIALAVVGPGVRGPRDVAPVAALTTPTTFLVEGRVALQVPAEWPLRRVTDGPGSARVEVVSPSDPQVMLHVTQSSAPGQTLAAAAESLQHALVEARAPDVFVDFDPAGVSAGRPAVIYRELRGDRRIDWTVLVDGPVRISIGCQSAADDAAAVRAVCEQAVRSARALG